MRNLFRTLIMGIVAISHLPSLSLVSAVAPDSVNRVDVAIDTVYQGFQNPPAEARPFVRWWWNNNQLEEKEILRELDLLKAAGIGGVEINPIAAKEGLEPSKTKVLTWRSPQWDKMLHVACKGAAERGLVVDLIAGSGWPFGGEFLKPDEQIMRVSVVHEKVKGPAVFIRPKAAIFKQTYTHKGKKTQFINPSIAFVMYYPKDITSSDQIKDITHSISKDGMLQVDIPEGEYIVAYGLLEQGYRKVVHGAKGAMGPTMDHMQKRVTRIYLDRLKGVEDSWGEPLSTYVRAIFCDSIETGAANWTHNIVASFQKSMGYDIRPFLPLVIDPESRDLNPSDAFADTLRRAKYDWNAHQVGVFLENFTSEYSAFCHDHQLLSRYQAYGTPYLMGMAEGYMIPDIPESNNWLYSVDPYAERRFTSSYDHGYMIWSKYTAAGGRLRGKKIISTEAMTNTRKIFNCTLGTIKQADDMNFITGITHSVLHGFNYVPPDVPFPGLIRYGTYFSEYNTWWPYMKYWTNYNARLSHVLQSTKPVSNIAIIGPTPDIWSREGLVREPFHSTPAYLHKLWEPISQLGSTCDYLHEAVIQKANIQDGLLRYGPMAYKVLLVVDMQSMQPDTAKAIQRFAQKGGKVIYVNQTPNRSPSLVNADLNDQRVVKAVAASLLAGAKKVASPRDEKHLRDWVKDVFENVNFTLDLVIQNPRDGLYQIRHTALKEDVFFFTNTYRRESSRTRVEFKLGTRGLWRWNPEIGQRMPYDLPYDKTGFELDLRPLESILLVTGTKEVPAMVRTVSMGKAAAVTLDGPWTVAFSPAQSKETFTIKMEKLSDFTQITNPKIKSFSGTATYSTTFQLDDFKFKYLELGWDNDFVSQITLNGKPVGVNWYGSQRFDVSDKIKLGSNKLVITYITTLYNKMKAPQQPSGLIGPVRLLESR